MFMSCIHGRVYMWEVEPRLYWRVKLNGKWTWRTAVFQRYAEYVAVQYISPEGEEE